MRDLLLNNGKTAVFKGHDFWSRPYYQVAMTEERTIMVCCVDLNGTNLHYYSNQNDPDSDPSFRLRYSYQPRQTTQQ